MTHRSLLAAAVLAAALAAAPPPVWAAAGSDSVRSQEKARAYLDKGDPRAALVELKNAVRHDPANASARYELGMMQMMLGDLPSAEKEFRQAREHGHPPAEILPLLASVYLAQGKVQQALDDVAPCPADAACAARVLALHARARLGLGQVEQALATAETALSTAPALAEPRLARALVAMRQEDMAKARAMVEQVLAADPGHGEALSLRGDIRRLSEDMDGAVADYQAAVAANGNDIASREKLALALVNRNRDDEAAVQVDAVLQRSPKAVMASYIKALTEARAQRFDKALEAVRPVEEGVIRLPNGLFLLAVIHAGRGNLEQAQDFASRAHAKEPENLAGMRLLAGLLLRRGFADKVVALLEPAQDRLGGDEAMDVLASAYLMQGRMDDAARVLGRLAKAHPGDDATRARLAFARMQSGGTRSQGVKELEAIMAQGGGTGPQAEMLMVMGALRIGDHDRAVSAARAMSARFPKSALPEGLAGMALSAKGDTAGARAAFESALAREPDYLPAIASLAELDLKEGDSASARRRLDQALARRPAEARLLMARAQLELADKQPAEALPFLDRAVASAGAKDPLPRIRLTEALLASGARERAQKVAAELLKEHAGSPVAALAAGRAFAVLGRPAEALEAARRMAALRPDIATRLNLAQMLAVRGHEGEARQLYDRILAEDPRHTLAWVQRVQMEMRQGSAASALALAEKAGKENPALGTLLAADIKARGGKAAEAEADLAKLMEAKPSTDVVARLASLAVARGDRPRARKLLADWLVKHPEEHSARSLLADELLSAGLADQALPHYEAVVDKAPGSVAAWNNLAWIYGRRGDPRALEAAARAHALAPLAPEVADTYGMLLYRGGETRRGGELIRQAFAGNPRNPSIAYHMAVVLADQGDKAGARRVLEPVISARAAFDEAAEAARLLARLGES